MENSSQRTLSNIKLLTWNANGLIGRKDELLNYMNRREIDVTAVCETHLSNKHKIKFPGYNIIRNDRKISNTDGQNNSSGGTAIIIRNDLRYQIRKNDENIDIEHTSIYLMKNSSKVCKLTSVYNQPQNTLKSAELKKLTEEDIPTILLGDFNAKHSTWNSKKENTNGKILFNFATNKEDILVIGPAEPTHEDYAHNSDDVLDIAVIKNLNWDLKIYTVHDLTSDHYPVELELCNFNIETDPRLNFKYDWDSFKCLLEDINPQDIALETTEDIDEAIQALNENIIKAVNLTKTEIRKNIREYFKLPTYIENLIKRRNQLRKSWKKTRNPNLKPLVNKLTKKVSKSVKEYKTARWMAKLQSLEVADNSLWAMMKTLRGNKPIIVHDLVKPDGNILTDDMDKANLLADSLENQFITRPPVNETDFIIQENVNLAIEHLNEANPPESEIPVIDTEEIKEIIRNMKNRKAPGNDGIKSSMLKALPPNFIEILCQIVNACWQQHYFPTAWKSATIVSILKPKADKSKPSSYRPISLLPCAAKLLERTILKRFLAHCQEKDQVRNEQFGFRANHGCTLQLWRLVNEIKTTINKKHYIGLVCLDVRKAFDTVWHEGLLFKLTQGKVPVPVTKMIKSYLLNRSFRTRVGRTCLSDSKTVSAGVPQGSILAPFLFNFYARDIPATPRCQLYLYADDTAITSSGPRQHVAVTNLQKGLNNVSTWFEKWRLALNKEKCTATLFNASGSHPTRADLLQIERQYLPWNKNCKYLGITFDAGLCWKNHTDITINKAKRIYGMLYSLLGKSSSLSTKNKVILFKTVILAVLTYGMPIWANMAEYNWDKLNAFQTKTLRNILGKYEEHVHTRDVYDMLKMEHIGCRVQTLARNIMEKIPRHENKLVRDLLQATKRKEEELRKSWPQDVVNHKFTFKNQRRTHKMKTRSQYVDWDKELNRQWRALWKAS